MNEKNKEIIEEVLDEIESTLNDSRGMYIHQRRIALSLSLGSVALIENYLNRLGVLKPGYQINHQWFKKKKENVKKIIDDILITSLNNNQKFDEKSSCSDCKDTEHWGSAETGIRYSLLANALKRALEIKLISMKDLYQDDEYILRKLKASTDRQILASLSLLSHNIKFKVNLENPQYSFHKKFRYIDPEFLQNKIIHRLSSVDKSYAELLEKHRKINEQGIKVSLLS